MKQWKIYIYIYKLVDKILTDSTESEWKHFFILLYLKNCKCICIYMIYMNIYIYEIWRIIFLVIALRTLLNPTQDGLFRGCSRFGSGERGWKKVPLPKICRTYPTKMKLDIIIPYLKKTQEIYESRDTHLEFC